MHPKCSSCPLQKIGRRPVPGRKSPLAKLIIIDEYPTLHEERQKEPFTSSVGRKFKLEAQKLGINESDAYYTFAIKCRIPPFFSAAQVKEVREHCRVILDEELDSLPVITVFAMGSTCAQMLLSRPSVDALAGFVYPYRDKWIIPSHSPFFALNTEPQYKPALRTHLLHAHGLASNKIVAHKYLDPVIKPLEYAGALKKILNSPTGTFVGVDVETVGGGYDDDVILRCVGLATKDLSVSIPYPMNSQIKTLVNSALSAEHLVYCYHNGSHDVPVLERFGFFGRNDFDTMCAHYVLAAGLKHSLSYAFALEYLAPNWKLEFHSLKSTQDLKGVQVFADAPLHDLLVYNARDCEVTALLAERLHLRLVNQGAMDLFKEQMHLTYEIGAAMTKRGIITSREHRNRHEENCLTRRAEALKLIHEVGAEYGFEELNPRSPKQLHRFYFDIIGVKPSKYSKKTRKPSLDEEALQPYLSAENNIIRKFSQHLLSFRKWDKQYSTYIKNLPPVVRAGWRSFGALTGRWSSSGPNMQNVDKSLHDMFIAREGFQLMEADYSQLELKIAAVLSGDTEMVQAFLDGADAHTATAQRLFKVKNPTKSQRKLAKAFNFGVNYGATSDTIWANLIPTFPDLTLAQVNYMMDDFKNARPKLAEFQRRTYNFVKKNRYLELPLSKRRIYFHGVVKPTEVANYPIQGTAGDVVNDALQRVYARIQHREDTFILMQIHDAIIGETQEPNWFASILQEEMERPVTIGDINFSFSIDVETGTNWGELKPWTK